MIRILIVNEIPLIANIIAATLEDEPDLTVAGSAASVDEALAAVVSSDIDLVLVSTHLPEGGAMKLTRSLAKSGSHIKVVVLGLNEVKEQVLPYVEAGASGYVLQDDSVETMLESIRLAHADQAQVSPRMAAILMSRVVELARLLSEIRPTLPISNELTPREMEVLGLIEKGLSNQEIADRLVIEVGTVKNHVHSILDKLDVNSRIDAATYLGLMRQNQVENRMLA